MCSFDRPKFIATHFFVMSVNWLMIMDNHSNHRIWIDHVENRGNLDHLISSYTFSDHRHKLTTLSIFETALNIANGGG